MDIEKKIAELLSGFQPATAFMAACELGLFEELKQPARAEKVAQRLGLDPRATLRLLNALVGMAIVVKEGEHFYLPEGWRKFLLKEGERYLGQWVALMSDLQKAWVQLPEFVRNGRNITSIMDMLGGDPARMRGFIDAMHDKALKATAMIAREIPLGEARQMLDVGGGPGTYALEWASAHPRLKATVFDIPPVLEVAKEYIRRYQLENRVTTQAGDFNRDALGTGYDLVLLANVLHMYNAETAEGLVKRAVTALAPGGRLIVHGFTTDEGGTSPLEDAMFSINIGLLTEGGNAHPLPEMTRWVTGAGLTETRSFRIDGIPTGVLTAKKAV